MNALFTTLILSTTDEQQDDQEQVEQQEEPHTVHPHNGVEVWVLMIGDDSYRVYETEQRARMAYNAAGGATFCRLEKRIAVKPESSNAQLHRPADPFTYGQCYQLILRICGQTVYQSEMLFSKIEMDRIKWSTGMMDKDGNPYDEFGIEVWFQPVCESPAGYRWDDKQLGWVGIDDDDTEGETIIPGTTPEVAGPTVPEDSPAEARSAGRSPQLRVPVADPFGVLKRHRLNPSRTKYIVERDDNELYASIIGFEHAQREVESLNEKEPGRYSLRYAEMQPPMAIVGKADTSDDRCSLWVVTTEQGKHSPHLSREDAESFIAGYGESRCTIEERQLSAV